MNEYNLLEQALIEMKIEDNFLKKFLSSPQKVVELKNKLLKLLSHKDIRKLEKISNKVNPNILDRVENTIKKLGKNYPEHKNFFQKYFTTKFKIPEKVSSILAIPFAYIVSISKNDKKERNKILVEMGKKSITDSTEKDVSYVLIAIGFLIKFALSYEIVSFIPFISMSGSILSMLLVVIVFLTITKIINEFKKEIILS